MRIGQTRTVRAKRTEKNMHGDEHLDILRTPCDPPITPSEWLAELRSYCAMDEQPTIILHEEEQMVVSFPSKYTMQWEWEYVHPVDAIMHAIDAGAITKTAGNFSHDYTRLLKHRDRSAMTPCQRMAHDLCDGHPDILSAIDDSDPHHPAIDLRKWPSAWLSIQRGADGYRLDVDGPQGEQARASGELGPVFEHFDRISHQLYK